MASPFSFLKLFGLNRDENIKPIEKTPKSFVTKETHDGTIEIPQGSGIFSVIEEFSSTSQYKSEAELLRIYRECAEYYEVDKAIEDIIDEAIVFPDHGDESIAINLSRITGISESIKTKIVNEFKNSLILLNFNKNYYDIFRSWYVDGRLAFHVIYEKNAKNGVKELRYIDPACLRKIRETRQVEKDGVKLTQVADEYYLYSDAFSLKKKKNNVQLKIKPEAIIYTTSGLLCSKRERIHSYLHKVLKPARTLQQMEDSLVIYRISRAPERRIFYIDVGTMNQSQVEKFMNGVINKYRNKVVFNSTTGEVHTKNRHMSIQEDFFLPRTEGGRGTEITTLPGGENLGQIEDILFFQKKLYKALNIPFSRTEQDSQFSIGRASEINRDEIKFKKFIDKLRKKFSNIFVEIIGHQVISKNICTLDEWKKWKNLITFSFEDDNLYKELKESELLRDRFDLLSTADEYIGKYVSKEYIRTRVLRYTDEEWKSIQDENKKDKKENPQDYDDEEDDDDYGGGGGDDNFGGSNRNDDDEDKNDDDKEEDDEDLEDEEDEKEDDKKDKKDDDDEDKEEEDDEDEDKKKKKPNKQ